MNRYVQEVSEMDRHRARLLRVLSVAGITALVLAAVWSAELPTALWSALRTNHTEEIHPQQVVAQTTTMSASGVTPSDPTAVGGNSSLAPPQQLLRLIATNPGKNEREGTARIGTSAVAPQTYVAGAVLVNGTGQSKYGEWVVNAIALVRAATVATIAGYAVVASATSQIYSDRTIALVGSYADAAYVIFTPAVPNLEGCPYTVGDEVVIDWSTNPNAKAMYATVLAAYLAGRKVGFGVSACYQGGAPPAYRADMAP
jgi:hypothetical protein